MSSWISRLVTRKKNRLYLDLLSNSDESGISLKLQGKNGPSGGEGTEQSNKIS